MMMKIMDDIIDTDVHISALEDGHDWSTLCGLDSTTHEEISTTCTMLIIDECKKVWFRGIEPTCTACILLTMTIPESQYTCDCQSCQGARLEG